MATKAGGSAPRGPTKALISFRAWLAGPFSDVPFRLRDVSTLGASTVLQIGISFLTISLLARTWGEEGLGLISLSLAAYVVGSALTDMTLGLNVGATVLGSGGGRRQRAAYVRVRLVIWLVIGISSGLAMGLSGSTAVAMASVGLVGGATSSLGDGWLLLASNRTASFAATELATRLTTLAAVLLGLLAGSPLMWVPISYLLGAASGVCVSYALCSGVTRDLPVGKAEPLLELVRGGIPMLAGRLLFYAGGQSAPLLLALVLSPSELGRYAASDRIVRSLQSLLYPLALSMYPHFAKRAGRSLSSLAVDLRRGMWVTLVVAAVLALLTIAFAGLMVALLYGPSFSSTAQVLRIEVLLLIPTAIGNTIIANVLSLRRDGSGVIWVSLSGAVTMAFGLLVIHLIPSAVTAAAVMVFVETAAMSMALLLYRLRRRSTVGIGSDLRVD